MGDIEEIEDQKLARFLRGLNTNVSNTVELYPYADFETLCGLCLKLEAQVKAKYGGGSSSSLESAKNKFWSKPESSMKSAPTSGPIGASSSTTAPKLNIANKETSLSKVRCFKCQGFGHYQNACPNKRVVTLREAVDIRDELM